MEVIVVVDMVHIVFLFFLCLHALLVLRTQHRLLSLYKSMKPRNLLILRHPVSGNMATLFTQMIMAEGPEKEGNRYMPHAGRQGGFNNLLVDVTDQDR